MGKPVIMGRKTWESLPSLARRTNVLSGDARSSPRAVVCDGFARRSPSPAGRPRKTAATNTGDRRRLAVELARPRQAIYLTEVDAEIEGDVVPPIDESRWTEVRREAYPAGDGDEYPFTFRVLERR